ncbi:MAG: hypothetical protein CMJ54_09745 [Planctomycetaceae bacterium]|nr:hypothetical protein [Planctomycetaceae bacterium]
MAKKTTKKSSAKKTTKKSTAKKTTKKTTRRAASSESETAVATETPTEPTTETPVEAVLTAETPEATAEPIADTDADAVADEETAPRKKRSRRGGSRRRNRASGEKDGEQDTETEDAVAEAPDASGDAESDDDASGSEEKKSASPAKKARPRREWKRPDRAAIEVTPTGPTAPAGSRVLLVDDVPGESCRIAILEKGRLEELFVERTQSATAVGNIYKARVVNVESSIQAAFVDYGQGMNGFLHVSDLHPRYFPGGDKTEKVGRKTPRRERPPIQDALKKGQEILVQVLKQGVGTKGPTVTSYLSIPGRLLVMMPGMDRVGVSRKVDDEQREKMRRILDELDLPDGFGFIVRTAGYDKTKTELKRDAAYLKRLWTQLEKRMDRVGAPSELYTEGDLVVRTIRDVVDASIDSIVINSRSGFERASTFLSVVSPKSGPKVRFYDKPVPLFDAFEVERQIDLIHAREVPLRSGGALVIDQTEAMVAIDVNSGRSRGARDAESNAVSTNREAADEIVRQLRLRDQGGLVVCDFIDMRFARNRKEIEDRLAENLRQDRARTTFLPISEFGLVEMTRQRIRPSIRSQYFSPCPECNGLGEIRNPDSVAADAVRRAARILTVDKVERVEVVCGTRVASALLSGHRRRIDDLERRSGGRVDIRISEQIGSDRFDVYAYDDRNADIDISRLPSLKTPVLTDFVESLDGVAEDSEDEVATGNGDGDGRRRRRRRRKPAPADVVSIAMAGGFDVVDDDDDDDEETIAEKLAKPLESDDDENPEGGGRKRRRRRRRRGRGNRADEEGGSTTSDANPESTETPDQAPAPAEPESPIRVHALAKELEITSKEILAAVVEKLETLELKNHMSSIPGEFVGVVRSFFAPDPPESPVVEDATPSTTTEDAPATPQDGEGGEEGEGGEPRKKRRRRRRGGRRRRRQSDDDAEGGVDEARHSAEGSDEPSDEGGSAEPRSTPGATGASEDLGSDDEQGGPDADESEHAVAVVETAAVPIKPKKRSLYGGRYQRRSPGQSSPSDR